MRTALASDGSGRRTVHAHDRGARPLDVHALRDAVFVRIENPVAGAIAGHAAGGGTRERILEHVADVGEVACMERKPVSGFREDVGAQEIAHRRKQQATVDVDAVERSQ